MTVPECSQSTHAASSSTTSPTYQHLTPFIEQCSSTMAACTNCAERSHEEGLSCWKNCRPAAELTTCLMRLIALNYGNEKVLQSLMNAVKAVLTQCSEHCARHANEHCTKCAQECRKLVKDLEEFQPTPVSITSVIGM